MSVNLGMVKQISIIAFIYRQYSIGILEKFSDYDISSHSIVKLTLNPVQSISRKGNCLDNAAMASFFYIMKAEIATIHYQKPE